MRVCESVCVCLYQVNTDMVFQSKVSGISQSEEGIKEVHSYREASRKVRLLICYFSTSILLFSVLYSCGVHRQKQSSEAKWLQALDLKKQVYLLKD